MDSPPRAPFNGTSQYDHVSECNDQTKGVCSVCMKAQKSAASFKYSVKK